MHYSGWNYAMDEKFKAAYMRFTGQSAEIFQDLTLDECIEEIKVNPLFRLATKKIMKERFLRGRFYGRRHQSHYLYC